MSEPSLRWPETCRVLTWNLEWAPSRGRALRAARAVITEHDPDVVCFTEALVGSLPDGDHTIWADADYGYQAPAGRRKVGLWSRWGWTEVDRLGSDDLPGGRFVAGTTGAPFGAVRVVGVCVPWSLAHVSTGRRDRKPWEDHLAFLDILHALVTDHAGPLVVAGDINQRLTDRRAPVAAQQALDRALGGLKVPTAGTVPDLDEPMIDHIAHSADLRSSRLVGLRRVQDGTRVSDHDGAVLDLAGR